MHSQFAIRNQCLCVCLFIYIHQIRLYVADEDDDDDCNGGFSKLTHISEMFRTCGLIQWKGWWRNRAVLSRKWLNEMVAYKVDLFVCVWADRLECRVHLSFLSASVICGKQARFPNSLSVMISCFYHSGLWVLAAVGSDCNTHTHTHAHAFRQNTNVYPWMHCDAYMHWWGRWEIEMHSVFLKGTIHPKINIMYSSSCSNLVWLLLL